jgi:phosphatidylserine/phosphatidylglycerophosphate/cardiolipin synthase-like enzyme
MLLWFPTTVIGYCRPMEVSQAIARADSTAGEALERAVEGHHARRLRKVGWERILQPDLRGLRVAGDPWVREGNSVAIHIDGAEALPAMQRAMMEARSHVYMANWFLSPDFRLVRGGPEGSSSEGPTIRELLAELATRVDVRVLLWSGPPIFWSPLGRPEIKHTCDELTRGGRVRCLLDHHQRPLHAHHEKILVVDDQIAFVGGLDHTYLHGDRFDSSEHPLRNGVGWHDMAAELRGPAAADVAAHFRLRWEAVSGESLRPIRRGENAGPHDVQVIATIPQSIYPAVPRGVYRILEAYMRALSSARHLIYIENQFLWSPEIVEILRQKLLAPPQDDFRLLLLLPAKAATGTDDTCGQLGTLLEADHDNRLFASTIYSREGSESRPVYVHAKLAVVDDQWLTVGSANLNDHSLFNDTEVNLVVYDHEIARTTRERLWAEHLELPVTGVSGHPTKIIDQLWRPRAEEQQSRIAAGEPMTHRLAKLPHASWRSERLRGPLQNLVLDG